MLTHYYSIVRRLADITIKMYLWNIMDYFAVELRQLGTHWIGLKSSVCVGYKFEIGKKNMKKFHEKEKLTRRPVLPQIKDRLIYDFF